MNATGRSVRLRRALLVLLVTPLPGCLPHDPAQECLAATHRAFSAARTAEQHRLEACFHREGSAACRWAGWWVDATRARGAAAEEAACEAGALPAFGYAGAEAVAGAARASVDGLARGLFGRDAATARASGTGRAAARCQDAVLHAAGGCAADFVDAYHRCAAAAFPSARDAFDLVACKGPDPEGPREAACRAAIDDAISRDCAGLDPEGLFPGCEGDVAACARGHARRSVSRALNDAHGLCQDVLPGSLAESTLLQCFEPPPPEPIAWSEAPLPDGVQARTVEFDEGGEWLLVGHTHDGAAEVELAAMHADGSGFRCLTCDAPVPAGLSPVQRFGDGRRVLYAGANAPTPTWRVLECSPSLLDCQDAALVPVVLPPNPDPGTLILQYRVPWVTPDGARLLWTEVRLRGPGGNLTAMGRLSREADRYVVSGARVIAPSVRSLSLGTDAERWRSFTQPFEAKFGTLRGGLDQVEAGTPEAGHYDTSVIDLGSGEVRRLTRHPDHDEGIRFTPDEEWFVLQSARTDERVEFLGLLPRPPYLEWIAFSLHFVAIAGAPNDGLSPGTDRDERDCYVDPWLLDRWFERGDYIGQRLLRPEAGWVSIEGNAGGFGFSPDGTRLALIERRWRNEPPATRLRIASFPSRDPIPPERVVPIVPTPEPTWAIRYEDWIVPDTLGVTVIPGLVSGTATLRNAMPTAVAGELEVTYRDYSDDGLHVLDGFERIRIPQLVLYGAVYEVELMLRGLREGSMRGSVTYDFLADVNVGEVVSVVEGRVRTGPKTCFEAGLIPIP